MVVTVVVVCRCVCNNGGGGNSMYSVNDTDGYFFPRATRVEEINAEQRWKGRHVIGWAKV